MGAWMDLLMEGWVTSIYWVGDCVVWCALLTVRGSEVKFKLILVVLTVYNPDMKPTFCIGLIPLAVVYYLTNCKASVKVLGDFE